MTKITDGLVVSLNYVLTVDGETLAQTDADDPMEYLHGAEEILPGLERALDGKQVVKAIVVPNKQSEITKESLPLRVSNLVQISIETQFRDFPFYIRAKDYNPDPKTALSAFDIPTILLASRGAIKLILGDRVPGLDLDQERLELREIRNFELTLRLLIDEGYGADNSHVKVETMDYLKSL